MVWDDFCVSVSVTHAHAATNYKFLNYEINHKKKTMDPRNNHEKKLQTDGIPTRKNFGHTKYPRRHDGTMTLNTRDPWNLAHSFYG